MTAPRAIHLDTGSGALCGQWGAFYFTDSAAKVSCRNCLGMNAGTRPGIRAKRQRRIDGIEDYLFIGGDRISAAKAAERLGVTSRTVQRYRAVLRGAGRDSLARAS